MKLENGTGPRKVHSCWSLNTIFRCFQTIDCKRLLLPWSTNVGSKKTAEDGKLVILAAGENVNIHVSFVSSIVDVLRLTVKIIFYWFIERDFKLFSDWVSKGIENSGMHAYFIFLLSFLERKCLFPLYHPLLNDHFLPPTKDGASIRKIKGASNDAVYK